MFKSQGRPWPLTKNVVYKEVFNYFSKAKNIFNSFFLYFIEKNKIKSTYKCHYELVSTLNDIFLLLFLNKFMI